MATAKKKKWRVWLLSVLALLLILVIAAGCIWHINEFTIEVKLWGKQEITLQYGQKYFEHGAHASFYGTLLQTKPLSPEVTISGQVDETKLGTYTITYSAEFEGYQASVERTV